MRPALPSGQFSAVAPATKMNATNKTTVNMMEATRLAKARKLCEYFFFNVAIAIRHCLNG